MLILFPAVAPNRCFVLAVLQTAGQDPEDTTSTDPEMFMLPLPPEYQINPP
jgi:hypothetical protein